MKKKKVKKKKTIEEDIILDSADIFLMKTIIMVSSIAIVSLTTVFLPL